MPETEARDPATPATPPRTLTEAEVTTLDSYWRAANYLAVGQTG